MRNVAFEIIYETLEKQGHSDECFSKWFSQCKKDISRQDKNFVRRLSYGVIERAVELDVVLNHVSKTPVTKMKPAIRTILRMGVYELWYMSSIPSSATCNEMAELTKKMKYQQFTGFVNGILRHVARQDREMLQEKLLNECKDSTKKLSFQYSVPEDLVQLMVDSYGKKTAKKMFASFYEENPVTIRIQTMNESEEKVIAALQESGVKITPCRYLKQAYHIENFEGIEELPGFAEGHFIIQDESSMLPVTVAGICPGDVVLDVCSSPGGKALHAYNELAGDGLVCARDVSEGKIRRIQENAKRMKASSMEIKVWDGTVPDEMWQEKADVVIADVPCSGIGVIGRKPEIKYNAVAFSKELCGLQRDIIAGAITALKPGGTLVYSTCTVNPTENGEQAKWIAQQYDLQPESLDEYLPKELRNKMTAQGMLQIIPGIQEGNGFFVAKFRKRLR